HLPSFPTRRSSDLPFCVIATSSSGPATTSLRSSFAPASGGHLRPAQLLQPLARGIDATSGLPGCQGSTLFAQEQRFGGDVAAHRALRMSAGYDLYFDALQRRPLI